MGRMGSAGEGDLQAIERPPVLGLDIETLSPHERFAADPAAFIAMVNQLGLDRASFYAGFRRAFESAFGRDSTLDRETLAKQLGSEFPITKSDISGSKAATMSVPLLRIHAPDLDGASVEAAHVSTDDVGYTWRIGFAGSGMSHKYTATSREATGFTVTRNAGRQLAALVRVEIRELLVYLDGHKEPIPSTEIIILQERSDAMDIQAVDNDAPCFPDADRIPWTWNLGPYGSEGTAKSERDLGVMESGSVFVGAVAKGVGGALTAEVASGREIHVVCRFPNGHSYRGDYLKDPLGLRWVFDAQGASSAKWHDFNF